MAAQKVSDNKTPSTKANKDPKSLENRQRLSPRLQMIINGDDEVSSYRSVLSASVTAPKVAVDEIHPVQGLREAEAEPKAGEDRPTVDSYDRRVRVSCFVQLDEAMPPPAALPANARDNPRRQRGSLVIADLTREGAARLADRALAEGIAYVEPGAPLSHPRPRLEGRAAEAPASRRFGPSPGTASAAQAGPVLIGLIDVGGFDFSHADFLDDEGNTRFERIWDQGAAAGPPPDGFEDGRELTREQMNRAIRGAREVGVAPGDILPQSVQKVGAHGTHVASIAGGGSGVCPDAILAGVLIALDEEDQQRHRTFFDSTRLAEAVTYLFGLGDELAAQLGRPVPTVINISLGTNGHAHDGTSPISRWIDTALGKPGRCVCVAAGNAGQEAAQFEGDLGFVSGRIHASGRIPARGLTCDLEWQVVGNGIVDVSENEMEIWYEAGDELSVSVRSPSGTWSRVVGPGEFYENWAVLRGGGEEGGGQTFVSIYNERYHPANGANRISLFLSPRLKGAISGIEAGVWTVRLHGVEVRDGGFDAWIERDDPRPLGRIGETQAWRFPSYFTRRSNIDRSSVSSLGCGRDVIAVANADPRREAINISSSQGPTRDGRYKPDIAAPGTDVVAANGFASDDPRQRWISMTGTSMASPYVAGVAARMLQFQPRLTAVQIQGIMRRTAQPLPGYDYRWQDDAGFGQIRPQGCLDQAGVPFHARDLEKEDGEGEGPPGDPPGGGEAAEGRTP